MSKLSKGAPTFLTRSEDKLPSQMSVANLTWDIVDEVPIEQGLPPLEINPLSLL